MTLGKARELIAAQVQIAGGYNRNAVRVILSEVARTHGQGAVDGLIAEYDLETVFGIRPGTDFSRLFDN